MTCSRSRHIKFGRSRFPKFYGGALASTRKKCMGYGCSCAHQPGQHGGGFQNSGELHPGSQSSGWLAGERKSEALQGDAGPHQESTISVSVSAVVKKAKTIQYIIHFT